MCGITGFITKNEDVYKYLLDGLKILQNRGYDSAGICTLNKNYNFLCHKLASTNQKTAIESLNDYIKNHTGNYIGIAHTRWATHGAKTDNNSHPHMNNDKTISLVHNGIIENYKILKEELKNDGYKFYSETDTEVIVNLIDYYLKKNKNFMEALNEAINKLEGTWGLAILYKYDTNNIYLAKKGSPLLLTEDENKIIIASESSVFQNYTNKYIILNDNEILKIGFNNNMLHNYEYKKLEKNNFAITPEPYKHWMLKEIFEQPVSIENALNNGGRIRNDENVKLGGLNEYKDTLIKIKNLLIIGCGTSYYAGLYGSKFLKQNNCFDNIHVIEAGEFTINDIPKGEEVGAILLSQSGETRDVYNVMEILKNYNIMTIGIVNVVGSLIARESDCGIYLNAGREVSVASTKVFTSQIIVLILLSIWFAQNKNENNIVSKRKKLIKELHNLSLNFSHILNNIDNLVTENILNDIKNSKNIFILGKNLCHPICLEGALKIKEVSYIHAEGYSASSLKHGPFALIENNTPIILIILNDEYKYKMISTLEEVKSRGAKTIVITNFIDYNINHLCDHIINILDNGSLTSLLAVIPLQYIAYKLSLLLGYNPDLPRNLAKTCTTD